MQHSVLISTWKCRLVSLQNKGGAPGLQPGCGPGWDSQNRSQGSFNDASHLTVPQDQRAAGAENFGTLALFQHAHTCAGGLLRGARRAARPPLEGKGAKSSKSAPQTTYSAPFLEKSDFAPQTGISTSRRAFVLRVKRSETGAFR